MDKVQKYNSFNSNYTLLRIQLLSSTPPRELRVQCIEICNDSLKCIHYRNVIRYMKNVSV